LLLGAAFVSSACFIGDDDDTPDSPTQAATAASTTAAVQTPATTAPASATASPTATPTAEATPTPSAGSGTAAVEAAVALLDATYLETLDRAACEEANPPSRICITLQSGQETVDNGLARFMAGDLDVGGFIFFMGRLENGEWGYWFGTQQQVDIPEGLPAGLVACGAGSAVTVYGAPDGSPTGEVPHMAELTAEEFALSSGGTFGAGGERGHGWFRISEPAAGWVDADSVTDAAIADCLLHEELVGSRG
jgi:hypothetical protein